MRQKSIGRQGGFTLIEAMMVLLIAGILMAIGIPALQQFIHRSRIEGFAREASIMCQAARMESIKQTLPAVVRFDETQRRVFSWLDSDGDSVQDPDEPDLASTTLPGGLEFQGPGALAVEGLLSDVDGAWVVFNSDGSAVLDFDNPLCNIEDPDADLTSELEGACMRIADGRPNYLQISIGPWSTANIQVRKWNGLRWVHPSEEPWEWK